MKFISHILWNIPCLLMVAHDFSGLVYFPDNHFPTIIFPTIISLTGSFFQQSLPWQSFFWQDHFPNNYFPDSQKKSLFFSFIFCCRSAASSWVSKFHFFFRFIFFLFFRFIFHFFRLLFLFLGVRRLRFCSLFMVGKVSLFFNFFLFHFFFVSFFSFL